MRICEDNLKIECQAYYKKDAKRKLAENADQLTSSIQASTVDRSNGRGRRAGGSCCASVVNDNHLSPMAAVRCCCRCICNGGTVANAGGGGGVGSCGSGDNCRSTDQRIT
ncbi:keratin-associated protein 5-11 [Trichinella spiralis]|uniref:keratin-associated protein 5-11 n=1 Tax=Trichinella spiralis TaxID=6334 RepID=UPI0001EFE5A0|nr:keratin-associated protein 5-11 [Trichinella spiralis]